MLGVMKKRSLLSAFGLNVRRRREARGLSQEALAEVADIDRTYVSGIERGVRNPTLITVGKLARALGCAVHDLTSGLRS